MEIFQIFIIGTTGYILLILFDLAIIWGKEILKRVTLAGFVLTAVPYVLLYGLFDSPHSVPVQIILYSLLAVCAGLLVFSVFLEVRLFSSSCEGTLYKGGTYRISRHPGFLWYTGINCVIAVVFFRWEVMTLVIGLTIDNFLLIFLEDTVLFPRMFEGYDAYKREVPFLFSLRLKRGKR